MEKNLPDCLKSVAWSNDIIVYDSFSNDKTTFIAKDFGAKVVQRKFDNWSSHQNWALENINFKNQWVFYIDADERLSNNAFKEIFRVIKQNKNKYVAYEIKRKDYFGEKQLKFTQPATWFIRLYKPKFINYKRLVNPITEVNGSIGRLNSYLDHFPFSKGISHWITKHNSYSSLEAAQIIENKKIKVAINFKTLFLNKDKIKSRYIKKFFYYKLPFRPFISFIYFYFFKRGFIDGKEGLTYSILRSIYEYFICLKVNEIERRKNK